MDVHVRSRRSNRETSPDRVKVCMAMQQQQQKPLKVVKPIRRSVQVVYYLTRNGQLEHPHYMEITLLPSNPLRLRDFMNRLTVLRGKGMPSLYSWSSKRSYKNGYVWNDLTENDIIYPSDGAEYVLKGSELVDGCSGRFQQVQKQEPNNNHIPSSKSKPLLTNLSRTRAAQETEKTTAYEDRTFVDEEEQEEDEEEEEEDYEDEEKTSYTCSTTPHSRCSRGVSTDELEEEQDQEPNRNPMTISTHSTQPNSTPPPPLQTSSSIISDKNNKPNINSTSERFEDGDPIAPDSATSRNSVLLHLISCGNLAVAKAKNNVPTTKQLPPNTVTVRTSENLRRGVLCKSAVKVADDDKDMIIYMSENPRFGNLQAEEKEYFSGSIVESMSEDRVATEPVLKKSNSFNSERSKNMAFVVEEEIGAQEEKRSEKGVKGKCIPRKKSTRQPGKK